MASTLTSSVAASAVNSACALGDLGHFRRRREAFERRRENGVSLGVAAGRLIELGEGERGAEFEAARALLLRDGDGGLERFLGRSGVCRVAFQEDFPADAAKFGVHRAMTPAIEIRHCVVNNRNRPLRVAQPRFFLGMRELKRSVKTPNIPLTQNIRGARHLLSRVGGPGGLRLRPGLEKHR